MVQVAHGTFRQMGKDTPTPPALALPASACVTPDVFQ